MKNETKRDLLALMAVSLLIGGLGLLSLNTYAGGETCTTSDGQTYTVPANRQIVLIPKLWNPEHLSYCIKGKVTTPQVTVEPPKCDSKLVISPAYCDPETGLEVNPND